MLADGISHPPDLILRNVIYAGAGFDDTRCNGIRNMEDARIMPLNRIGADIAGINTLRYVRDTLHLGAVKPTTTR